MGTGWLARRSCAAAGAAFIAAGALIVLGAPMARADLPNNDIVITPVGRSVDNANTVVGSRQPTINVQFNFGSTTQVHVECQADQGPFGSCGTQTTANCPASQCWVYTPAFPSDGDHTVAAAIFDSTLPDGDPNQPRDQLGFQIHIDSTLPDTRLIGTSPSFDLEHAGHTTVPVSYNYRTVDDADPILYEDSAQCALTSGSAPPTSWVDCSRTLQVPLTPQASRFWVRAVDYLGRPDPTPAVSAPFSAVPCRSQLLSHPRSLRQIARQGLRVRVHCLQPTRYYVSLELPTKELIALNQLHRDITSPDLGDAGGRTQVENGSAVLTLHLLRRIPADLFADRRLSLEVTTDAATETLSVVKRVTGR